MAASVPELTNRIRSIEGISFATRSASRVSSSVGAPKLVPCAAAAGERFPQALRRVSVDERPPGHHVVDVGIAVDVDECAPCARATNTGVPPTALNARTGLSTPPGRIRDAAANSFSERAYLDRFRRT